MDTALLPRVNYIASAGFLAEFVIDEAASEPLPAACERFARCCEAAPPGYQQQGCYDNVDDPARAKFACSNFGPAQEAQYKCPPQGGSGGIGDLDTDAGQAPNAQNHALCCYHMCGYVHAT
jgi:hypothetical protein